MVETPVDTIGAVPARQSGTASGGGISPHELADLVRSFTEITSKLEASHDRLRGEVARLSDELGQANQQLERSRRLAALGEMAAGIAHEVRNPLGSIRLYAAILMKDLPERERSVAVKIDAAARDLDGVVGDVLTFAKEIRLRGGDVDVRELCERSVEASGLVAGGAAGVEVEFDIARGLAMWADEPLARQALVNLIRNACEAVQGLPVGRRRIRIAAQRDRVIVGESENAVPCVVIRIEDCGDGVSAEVQARMFNPFFTTRAAGTGLGLSIVHRIVDAHGGVVSIRNNVSDDGTVLGTVAELAFPNFSQSLQ